MIQAQDGHSRVRDMRLDSRHSLMADSLGCKVEKTKQNKTKQPNKTQNRSSASCQVFGLSGLKNWHRNWKNAEMGLWGESEVMDIGAQL